MRTDLEASRELELDEARRLQQAMIPKEPLRAHAFEIACQFHPADKVGGDFADYFVLPNRLLNLYLGDVVGKGLPAALYAALAAGMLRGFNKTGESPQSLLERFNQRLLLYAFSGRYCASQYAVLNPETLTLTLGNAGLPLPMHITPDGCCRVGGGGFPSGMFPEARYEQHSVQLKPGDAVMFYTDGIVELADQAREEFGALRLQQVCEQHQERSVSELLLSVFDAASEFAGDAPQRDDMTAIALKIL